MTVLRLHGYPVSNYFNIARAALIEKGVPHEIVIARAAQNDAFLAMNPMGKIPVLESPEGWIGETVAIVEYLDDRYPDAPLRPITIGERARARQIVNMVQMYIEGPTRSLFGGVFAGGTNDPATVSTVRATIDRATLAISRLANAAPFLVGGTLSHADLFAFYILDITERVGRFVWDRSILRESGLDRWSSEIGDRASTRMVMKDFDVCFSDYLAERNAPYRPTRSGQFSHA